MSAVGAVSGATATAARPVASAVGSLDPAADRAAVPLSVFLDRVAQVLRGGLPERLWIEATVVDARASASGHTLELTDPAAGPAATLRVFLSASALSAIRRDLGLPIDPALLVGMTTCLLLAPVFTRRWHLGGRVEALSRDAAASLRVRLLERIVATLQRERLWDAQRALPRPRDITRIAVIHPAGAAGWGDIAAELGRWQAAGLVSVRSHAMLFEGDRAAAALVAGLRAAVLPIAEHRPDVVLMVRGGGARVSLAVLDDEAVARAVLACPVPVICGTGHAQDRSLADRVAWQAVDTPSKAVFLVGSIIRAAAQAATKDRETILRAAETAVLTQATNLEANRQAVLAAATRILVAADRLLADRSADIRVDARDAASKLQAAASALDHALAIVLLQAPRALEQQDGELQRLLQAGLARALVGLDRVDTGATTLARVFGSAEAGLHKEEIALQRCREAVAHACERHRDRAEVALERLLALVEAGDPSRMLARGLAIVTDQHGTLLPTRAAAAAEARVLLQFADGMLPAVPIVA